jgi:hypothetical protein
VQGALVEFTANDRVIGEAVSGRFGAAHTIYSLEEENNSWYVTASKDGQYATSQTRTITLRALYFQCNSL